MPSANQIRREIEAALAQRIPAALSPMPRAAHPVLPTGEPAVDQLLEGGLPIGAVTEFAGEECSGRTSLALSFLARATAAGSVCAWVDVGNALDPISAAAAGIDLSRLLWARCELAASAPVSPPPRAPEVRFAALAATPPHTSGCGGGCGPHPRGESNGLSHAVGEFLHAPAVSSPARRPSTAKPHPPAAAAGERTPAPAQPAFAQRAHTPWAPLDRALRILDLLLQAGGFAAIVCDMGGIAPECVTRIPLASWFRFRAAAEKSQTCLILLTRYACAKSSAELLLRFQQGEPCHDDSTVFSGLSHRVEIARRRFLPASNVVSIRKPPRAENGLPWRTHPAWAGAR